MSDALSHASLFSRPRCLDVTARYEGTILVTERIWDPAGRPWPRWPLLIAFAALMSAGGLMWLRTVELSVRSRHRNAMIAFARAHPQAAAFVPRLEASPLVEQGALALALLAFAAGIVAAADFVRAVGSRRFLIGETECCKIPVDAALLSTGQWTLLRASDLGFELRVPGTATGSLSLGDRTLSFEEAVRSTLAKPIHSPDGAFSFIVPAASRVAMRLGTLEITVEDPLFDGV